MNLSIAPSHDVEALASWLDLPGTYAFSDTVAGIGESVVDRPMFLLGITVPG